jgi:hypothetical protein
VIAMAHYAALDALERREGEAGARRAARAFLRPGGVPDWLDQGLIKRAVQSAIEEFNMVTPDYFGIAKEIVLEDVDKHRKARADIEHLITVYGPVTIAQAAYLGLAYREREPKP